jgi:hypothetical protein
LQLFINGADVHPDDDDDDDDIVGSIEINCDVAKIAADAAAAVRDCVC